MISKESATQKVRIGDSYIDIVTYTPKYKNCGIEKMIVKYLHKIPKEDIKGLGKINVFHSTPDNFPRKISGKFYSKKWRRKGVAEINIYLYQTLAYMLIDEPFAWFRNKIFLIMFGKLFLANILFHEIGHHKYTDVSPKKYMNKEDEEKDAVDYATKLLWKAFPLRYRYYDFFNKLYRFLYKKRIKKAEKISMKETNSTMPPAN
jgi:hypothetical protein